MTEPTGLLHRMRVGLGRAVRRRLDRPPRTKLPFHGIRTDRLLIRPPELGDVDALVRRRNDPWVSTFYQWPSPFKREWAEQEIRDTIAMGGGVVGRSYTATICDDTGPIGDFVFFLIEHGKVGEINVAVDPEVFSKGYLREIEDAGLEYLFNELGIERLQGRIDPRNGPAVRLAERSGTVWEGHTRQSTWVDGEPCDDWVFGMLRSDWEAWKARPRHAPDEVGLVPADRVARDDLLAVTMHKSQEAHVGSLAEVFADSALDPEGTRVLAIGADGEVVGLVVVGDPVGGEAEIRRILVDRLHQRRGIGSMATGALVEDLRDRGASTVVARWADGWGSPGPFFERLGFEADGRPVDGVTTGRLPLQ